MREKASTVLSTIIHSTSTEPSYVLGTMYQVEPTIVQQEQHASKATPQYGFHKGIKEFADKGQEATKQELYENLLGMDAVTIIKLQKLEKAACSTKFTSDWLGEAHFVGTPK